MRTDEAMNVALDEVCRFTGWPVGHGCRIHPGPGGSRLASHLWHVSGEVKLARTSSY